MPKTKKLGPAERYFKEYEESGGEVTYENPTESYRIAYGNYHARTDGGWLCDITMVRMMSRVTHGDPIAYRTVLRHIKKGTLVPVAESKEAGCHLFDGDEVEAWLCTVPEKKTAVR